MPRPAERDIEALVKRFKRDRMRVWDAECSKYKCPTTRFDTINAALGLRDGDHVHSHQRRVGRKVLRIAQTRLHQIVDRIFGAKDFDELLQVVDLATRDVRRFGELAVYDVACRIGIKRGLKPVFVYLHAGTREGASALQIFGKKIEKHKFSKALQNLEPYQIEDFLCINKEFLKGRSSFKTACKGIVRSCENYKSGIC